MKKHVFNRIALALTLAALLCTTTNNVFAVGESIVTLQTQAISPRYATIKKFSADLTVSHEGQASCQLYVDLYNSYTAETTMYLQDRSSGWGTVKEWSSSGNSCSGSYYVSSGDTYRVKGVLRVYDSRGRLVETATAYSDTFSY